MCILIVILAKISVASVQAITRNDYNSLTSDIFQVILLNVRSLIYYLSIAMYGCPIKLSDNMAIDGFCLIISENLLSSLYNYQK